MTAFESQQWLAALQQQTGFTWHYRQVISMIEGTLPVFDTRVNGLELTIYKNGRWSLYDQKGEGLLVLGARNFQKGLDELMAAYRRKLQRTGDEKQTGSAGSKAQHDRHAG